MPRPSTVGAVCTTHIAHSPKYLTLDWHHVLPRDWQRQFVPPDATVIDDPSYGKMWHPEGIWICPTGHHNVHQAIVALMHGVKPMARKSEITVAQRALDLFTAAGGDLDVLRKAGCWGQM